MRRFVISGSAALVSLLALCVSVGTACSSSSAGAKADSGPIPVAAGGSGAFGIVTINGLQKMYLPLDSGDPTSGNGLVAVVNVGVAGNGIVGAPAQITKVDLGVPEFATATGGDSNLVIAASTSSNKVWFIDPNTDTLKKTITLDGSYGRSSFSGGGGYVTGIAMDSAHNRAILSVWNGFALVDLTTLEVTTTILAAPSENFGFDSVHQQILAPFYECASSVGGDGGAPSTCDSYKAADGTTAMTEGLNVIDLTDNTVYTYEDPNAVDPNGNPIPEAPLGSEPDSASVDPTTQQVVVPSEGGGFQNILDFANASFDKTKKTVTAPHHIVQNLALEGVAVENTKHFAFWESEHGATVAVASLSAVDQDAGPTTPIASMPMLPGGNSWENIGDPHGIAVTTGLADGHAVGFVVDVNLQWVARVDLEKMNALSAVDSGDGSNDGLTQDQMATVVTFLDATAKP